MSANLASRSAPAMTLVNFTNPNLMIPHLRGQDAPSVIQELSRILQREKRIPDLLPFYHAALNREYMVSTDMEAGMAFPHARLPGVRELSFALGRSADPLAWGCKTPPSVRLVFLIAVPATDATQYLPLISGLARLGRDSRLVARLQAATDSSQMLVALQQVELRTSAKLDLMTRTMG